MTEMACVDKSGMVVIRDVRRVRIPDHVHVYSLDNTIEVDGVVFDIIDQGPGWVDLAVAGRKEPPRETHPQLVFARNLWESQHDMRGLRSIAVAEKYGRSHLWEKNDAVQG